MSRLKKIAQSLIKTLFGDLRSAIVSILVAAAVTGSGGLLLFVESVRLGLIETMQKPTPLWVSIALAVMVILYTYLKTRSFQKPPQSKPRIEFFTTNKMKWKVTIHKDGWFEIDKYPFCKKHDVQFILSSNEKYCPGVLGERCDNNLRDSDHFKVYSSVESMVESKIRNGEHLC